MGLNTLQSTTMNCILFKIYFLLFTDVYVCVLWRCTCSHGLLKSPEDGVGSPGAS